MSKLRAAIRRWSLALWMLLAIGAILGSAVWIGLRANELALADFSHEQEVLAAAVGIDFEERLAQRLAAGPDGPLDENALVDSMLVELLAGSRRLERPGELSLLIARPGRYGFLTTDGRIIGSHRIHDALENGSTSVTIPREEAPAFGLPNRRAYAGIAHVTSKSGGRWGIVVLTSAWRMRARQEATMWRLALSVIVSGGIVAIIGAYARRTALAAANREREAALANADKMATVAALSTGIAHEIGTPLGVIMGRTEQVLGRPNMDERAASSLRIVLEQVERIQRIVRGSLALARGDAPELVPTPAAAVAKRASDLVRHRFAEAEVELVAKVPGDLPEVACSPALFEQALVNLLLNACHATPARSKVTLDVQRHDGHVVFAVEDEGAGIPDEVASRASEPFFSTRREQGGSGLGLTIAREIVKHHGGELALAKRSDGRGTRATISALVAA
ncbi:MAG: ATP-binding protein [Labilithrix sp.]